MTAELSELNAVVAEMPADAVRLVIAYARRLQRPAGDDVEMAELTSEELRAEANRVMRRFDAEHPGEDWSQQPFTPGYK